jgi:dTDP-4-amino-4,6-dideoxygalactose transaminase
MITTSVGGMLVGQDVARMAHARKLARQAREPVAHYEHTEVGYNYRMSNLLAAVGRVQLGALPSRVAARRRVFDVYAEVLRDVPGLTLQPEAPWNRHARWLSCLLIDQEQFGYDREALRLALASAGIETRAVWKPMHQQPVYRERGLPVIGGAVADDLFARGLCLPSSSSLGEDDVRHVAATIAAMAPSAHC